MIGKWSFIPRACGTKGDLYLDDGPIAVLVSAGPGHIIDTGEMIAKAMTERNELAALERQTRALESIAESLLKLANPLVLVRAEGEKTPNLEHLKPGDVVRIAPCAECGGTYNHKTKCSYAGVPRWPV